MLSKNELFYIKISQKKSVRIIFVGILEGIEEKSLKTVKLMHFEDLLVLAVRENDRQNVSVLVASRLEVRPVEILKIQTLELKNLADFEFLEFNGTLAMAVLEEKKEDPNKMM